MNNNDDIQKNNEEIITEDIVDEATVDDSSVSDDDLNNETFTYRVDNNNVNNDYNKNSYDDNKSYIYIIIGVLILFLIIFLLVLFANKVGSKSSDYSEIESKMVNAAKKYYDKNNELLPNMDSSSVSVSSDVLIQNSLLKPFSEMVDEGVSCSGNVSVFKSNDSYVYFPYLNCGEEYESLKLTNRILENVVTSGDGLYKIDDDYVFRGEFPNNYVKFDGKEWRILRINSDGSIKLVYTDKKAEKSVWDDRYNSEREGYVGINDFSVSRILDFLKDGYDNNIFVSKENKDLLVKRSWCIGKLSETDSPISSLNLCDDVYDDLYIGLINVDEVLIPSIAGNCNNVYDIECTNYNYFFRIDVGWTMNVSKDRSYLVFSSNGGTVVSKNASLNGYVRPVINVNGNVLYKSGTGTQEDPYLIGD